MFHSSLPASLPLIEGLVGFVLFGVALLLFSTEYGWLTLPLPLASRARSLEFLVTFYGLFALTVISGAFILMARTTPVRAIAWVAGAAAIVLLGYSIEAYLTVKLCLCAGFLVIAASRSPWPWNVLFSAITIAVIYFFQFRTSLFGESLLAEEAPRFRPGEALAFVVYLSLVTAAACVIRGLHDRLRDAEAAVSHLDLTIDRLSDFNQDLQRYARVADEEAITKERNRISREIHDISGYIFTNLIALMDAAVSMGGRDFERLGELHLAARSQAKEGLQETRRALRELRASDSHRDRGIAAIYKIKTVFERVTGIEVTMEAGNLPPSFGDEMDLAIYRVVQEALTNAMRHGRATKVAVCFWIADGILELCVQDDGIGSGAIEKGIGLAGMEERLARFGGTVRAGNAPEGGFRLLASIPLPQEEKNER